MANLAPHKGQATVLRAIATLKQRGTYVECWLAGEDRSAEGHEAELRKMAAELGITDRVRFLGSEQIRSNCCALRMFSYSRLLTKACP